MAVTAPASTASPTAFALGTFAAGPTVGSLHVLGALGSLRLCPAGVARGAGPSILAACSNVESNVHAPTMLAVNP